MGRVLELPNGCVSACRACPHREFTEAESLGQKQEFVRSCFLKSGFEEAQIDRALLPIVGPPSQSRWHYRTRTCLHTDWSQNHWKIGLIRDDSVLDLPQCPIHSALVNAITDQLRSQLPGGNNLPLRFILITGPVVTLVLKAPWTERQRYQSLLEPIITLGIIQGVQINFNPAAGKRVLASKKTLPLKGLTLIQDAEGFWSGPASFAQAIPELHKLSLERAEQFLEPGPGDFVADLYSGVGRSVRRWQKMGAKTQGVELSSEAVACAEKNGVPVWQGRTPDRIPQFTELLLNTPSGPTRKLLYTNPPRMGMDPVTLKWITDALIPHRISYLSCSPQSLARDLWHLTRAMPNLKLRSLQPLDFFPLTRQVEILANLSLENP